VKKARVVFAGTPDFALASLKALISAGVTPLTVLTQPDRRAGRGKKMTPSPVKTFSNTHEISVWQPHSLTSADVIAKLAALAPDLVIVSAYGLLLPQEFLDVPRRGCLNVHASLLPRWRGAAPIQAAILSGDDETGVSLMRMEAGLDTGAVFQRSSLAIGPDESAGELYDRLATLGGEVLVENLAAILDGAMTATPQDEAAATHASKIKKSDAVLRWDQPATDLHRLIRAYDPVPGARFEFRGEDIKCWRAGLAEGEHQKAGKILSVDKGGIVVACGDGSLRLTQLQRPGRGRVTAAEFASQFDLQDDCF